MEAALLEDVIRRGREANTGIGRRPTVPSSRSKKPQQSSGSSLSELQEQLKRKKALLADKEVIDELPDKGARIRAHIADLENRINALTHGYELTSQTGTLEERLKVMSLDSANMAAPATSSVPSTQPSADVALVHIPNPFKGNIFAPTARTVRYRASNTFCSLLIRAKGFR